MKLDFLRLGYGAAVGIARSQGLDEGLFDEFLLVAPSIISGASTALIYYTRNVLLSFAWSRGSNYRVSAEGINEFRRTSTITGIVELSAANAFRQGVETFVAHNAVCAFLY